MSKTNPEIFKAYDIRGIYPEDIDEKAVYNIARALAEHLKAGRVVVGRDIRNSSLDLEKAFVEGLTDSGCDAVLLGLSTTPMVYFASGKMEDVDAGVIITASHNPGEYNGLKLCKKDAVPIGEGSGMEEIKELALKGDFAEAKEKGEVEKNDEMRRTYIGYMTGFFKTGGKKKKVAVDYANAMGILDREVFEQFPEDLEMSYLFEDFDGNFPNHEANPLKTETLEDLCEKVKKEGADLGVAYDGDADRAGFVDENGRVVPMDFTTALIGKEILKKHPGGLVLVDLRSSNAVKEFLEESGGKVEHCRVGHSLIKAQMRRQGAVFAGELSGHYFFEENYKAEMTTLAVIMILNLLNETGKTMSEITEDLRRYHHTGEINSEVKDKKAVFDKLKEKYADGELNELDGVRIDYPDWWFNVRASNTEPKIRLNLEAKSKELMEEKRDEVLEIVRGN
ncbi:MAG: phosphomannomutase/phosphoglucomutase [Candidatus Moranbacteria bacterium]|nr:phosphomannomutase/phosphoglucomutase [Candidatus Moranbacteria bacterium]